jgi:hypothetical protein
MVVHDFCKTEVEYHTEKYSYPNNSVDSAYCYTMCPRCNTQLYYKDLIIGYGD